MPILINDNARETDRRCSILLIAITCLAALFRFWQCNESLWLDETHTAWVVADGFANITARAKAGNYGPVYFWLPWLTTQWFGMSELALRLPSLIAGLCLVPVCYLIARDWFCSAILGLLAASLVAIDPHSLFYSLEARPYSLVQLFSAVHVWLLVRILNIQSVRNSEESSYDSPEPTEPTAGSPEPTAAVLPSNLPTWSIVSFCVVGILLFQLHFTSGLLFTAELAIVAWSFFLGKLRESVVATGCLTLIGISCLTTLGTIQQVASRRKLWNQFIEREADFRVLFPWGEYVGSALLVAIVVALVCWVLARQLRGHEVHRDRETDKSARQRIALATASTVVWLVIPLSVAYVCTRFDFARLFYRRYTMHSYPALILLTVGIGQVVPSRRGKAAYSVILFVAVLSLLGPQHQFAADRRFVRHSHEDWRRATQELRLNAVTNRTPISKRRPVFVRTGLVEERLIQSQSALGSASDYLLFPVSSIYSLGRRHTHVLTSNLMATDLSIEQLAEESGGTLIVRGRKWFEANKSSILVELARRLADTDPAIEALVIEPEGVQYFGNLVVAELKVVRRPD